MTDRPDEPSGDTAELPAAPVHGRAPYVPDTPETPGTAEAVPETPGTAAAAPESSVAGVAADAQPVAGAEAPIRRYELPNARALVGRGFDLMLHSTADIRRASWFLGLQVLGVAGPVVLLGLVVFIGLIEEFGYIDTFFLTDRGVTPLLGIGFLIAVLGVVAISIEAEIVAVALLAGRLIERPLSLREAVLRSRQTFWTVLRASILVGIVVGIPSQLVTNVLAEEYGEFSQIPALGSALVALIIGVPFVYVPSGIVLGDVRAVESIRRSISLARARPSLAFTISLFAAATGYIQFFAVGSGLDLLARAGEGTGLGFTSGLPIALATTAVILLGVLAIGSLIVTVGAITAAPQVVAFVGLTWYAAGLERLRPGAVDARGFPITSRSVAWLSRPMTAGIVLSIVSGLLGFNFIDTVV